MREEVWSSSNRLKTVNKKCYLITGGGSGTGKAVSKQLVIRGAETIIWGRRQDALKATVDAGEATDFQIVDISDQAQVTTGFTDINDSGRILSGVIHAAGIWTPGSLIDLDPNEIVQHIQVITVGTVLVSRQAAITMQKTGGSIVVIAAASALDGFEDTALNTLAKRAIDGLSVGLAEELRGMPIQLTTIYPDSMSWDRSRAVVEGEAMKYGDVANAVLFTLELWPKVQVEKIVLTAPKTGKGYAWYGRGNV